MTLVENGPLCTCGNRGCLEALAGGGAIARQARELVRQGTRTHLSSMVSSQDLTARDVAEAAAQGDHAAQQILAQAGEYIGTALAGVLNLLNPGVVVIGGGVAQAGDLLLEPIRAQIKKRSLQAGVLDTQITSASLGQRSTAMGAVAAALSVCFDLVVANQPVPEGR
jgi:predicted NBD/HSP70 family sugar kinase